MQIYRIFYPVLAIVILACSSINKNPTPNDAVNTIDSPQISSFRLYLSRAHLGGIDFEQYAFSNETLYGECGKINKGRSHTAQKFYKRISPLKNSELAALFPQLSKIDFSTLGKPGDNSDLFDSGITNLQIKLIDNQEIKNNTYLDSIASKTSPETKRINTFIKLIRAEYKDFCGLAEFYGL